MKYAYLALIGLIFVLGCEGVPAGDVGIDCGTDIACFQSNAETCSPAFIDYTYDPVVMHLNIIDGTPEDCNLNVKIKEVDVPDDAPQSVKAAIPLAKRTSMLCALTSAQISSLDFGQDTLDNCDGTLADILGNFINVEGVTAAPPAEDEAEIPPEAFREDGSIDWQVVCLHNDMEWDDVAGVCLEEGEEPAAPGDEGEPEPEEAEFFSTNPGALKVELVSIEAAQGLENMPGTEHHKRVNYLLSSKMEEAEYTFYALYKETGAKSTITWKTIGGTPTEGGYEWNSLEGYVQLGPGEYELIFEDKNNAEVYTSFEVSIEAQGAEGGPEPGPEDDEGPVTGIETVSTSTDAGLQVTITSVEGSMGGPMGDTPVKRIYYKVWVKRPLTKYNIQSQRGENSPVLITQSNMEGTPKDGGYSWNIYEKSMNVDYTDTYSVRVVDTNDNGILAFASIPVVQPGDEAEPDISQCSAEENGFCPSHCATGADFDCCAVAMYCWIEGHGCYDECTPGTGDCTIESECSGASDDCCPRWCAAGSDYDCCINAGMCWDNPYGSYGCYSCP